MRRQPLVFEQAQQEVVVFPESQTGFGGVRRVSADLPATIALGEGAVGLWHSREVRCAQQTGGVLTPDPFAVGDVAPGSARSARTCRSILSGLSSSSASSQFTNSPCTARKPTSRARLAPCSGQCSRCTGQGALAATDAATATLSSEEPLSTTIISRVRQLCARQLASVVPSVASASRQAITIETSGWPSFTVGLPGARRRREATRSGRRSPASRAGRPIRMGGRQGGKFFPVASFFQQFPAQLTKIRGLLLLLHHQGNAEPLELQRQRHLLEMLGQQKERLAGQKGRGHRAEPPVADHEVGLRLYLVHPDRTVGETESSSSSRRACAGAKPGAWTTASAASVPRASTKGPNRGSSG